MGASGSTINVGLQAGLDQQVGQEGDSSTKTYLVTQARVGGSTLGVTTGQRTLPIGPRNGQGADQAADGWLGIRSGVSKFRVFSDGVIFEGPDAATMDAHDLSRGYERLMGRILTRVMVGDKRAQQVLVAYADGRFWAVPSRQIFSRHLGVCLILGDKTVRGPKHKLQVGDIIRVGSVGLLVSEINSGVEGAEKQVVSQDVLDHIREDISTAPTQVLAPLREQFETGQAAEEGYTTPSTPPDHVQEDDDDDDLRNGALCYICMDESESEEDALIAPCLCKGSTALVHVKCLQRLLSTGDAHKTNVVSTRHESHTCKICKARYKTHVKLKDGTLIPLLNPTLTPPSLTLIVVTRHDPHPDLFNNIFQLSFARTTELSLGRSQACDVVIGYRTVSTRHATISYSRGDFFYQDNRSSNGSLLYLRGPLELPYNRVVRLRMGRSVLSLRARKTLQLSTLPRRTALDAVRWVSSLVRRPSSSSSGNGAGGSSTASTVIGGLRSEESSVSDGDPHAKLTGAELLRRLFEGELEDHRDRSIDEAIEQMNLMAWSMNDDSSSSSEKSGHGGGGGGGEGGGDGDEGGEEEDDDDEEEGGGETRQGAGGSNEGEGNSSRREARRRRGSGGASSRRGAAPVVRAEGSGSTTSMGPGQIDEDEGREEEEATPGVTAEAPEEGTSTVEGLALREEEEEEEARGAQGEEAASSSRGRKGGRGRRKTTRTTEGLEGGAAAAAAVGAAAVEDGQLQECHEEVKQETDVGEEMMELQSLEEEEDDEDDDLPPEGPRFMQPCSRSETGPPTSSPPFLHRTRSSVV